MGKSRKKTFIKGPTRKSKSGHSCTAIDADIRELTSLLYAAMGRFQQIRRTFAGALSLTSAEFAVVVSLHRLSSASVRKLSEDVHVAAANVTATIKSLVKKGWVVKRTDPRDGRALSIELSPASRTRLDKFFFLIHPVNTIWFIDTAPSEHTVVKKFLSQLVDQFPRALQEARTLKRKAKALNRQS